MRKFREYEGLSYHSASREGYRLVERATETGNWDAIVDRLVALRQVMACLVTKEYHE